MSTDPSIDPRDAAGAVGDGGHRPNAGAHTPDTNGSGAANSESSIAAHPAAGQGRRRGRRGRRGRRRTPESRSADESHRAADSLAPSADPPRSRRPSPADLAGQATPAHAAKHRTPASAPSGARPGGAQNPVPKNSIKKNTAQKSPTQKSPTQKNPVKKNTNPKGATPKNLNRKNPTAPADPVPGPLAHAPVAVSGPKPSDMAVVAAKITKTGLSQDTTAPTAEAGAATRGRRRPNRRVDKAERLRTVRETSAGGLVISDLELPADELAAALIGRVDRRGRMMWSLPKGHIETGETAEQTAVREVAEETGIQGTVVAPLGKIDYWFVSEGRRIHKTVHHYLLRSVGGELSDADYEVSEVAWVPLHELPRRLTYSDERRLARMARGVIADLAADPGRLAESEAQSSRTEPNAYERAAAARNQRRNEPPPARPRRRRRRPRRSAAGDG